MYVKISAELYTSLKTNINQLERSVRDCQKTIEAANEYIELLETENRKLKRIIDALL